MKVLFHVATDHDGDPVTAVFIDGNGFRYQVPANEATEIESDFMAQKIMEHCHYYGIVEVHVVRTPGGRTYDLEEAADRAAAVLLLSEKECINDYLKVQLESRVADNKPPLPPKGRQLECVIKHKFNLLRAGIRPVGWEPPYEMVDPEAGAGHGKHEYVVGGADTDSRMKQLEAENAEIKEKLNQLLQMKAIEEVNKPRGKAAKVGVGTGRSNPVAVGQ